ncbi:hypothetical protein D9M72_575380 [compost metagenome]
MLQFERLLLRLVPAHKIVERIAPDADFLVERQICRQEIQACRRHVGLRSGQITGRNRLGLHAEMRQIEKIALHHGCSLQQNDLPRSDLTQDFRRIPGVLPAVAALFVKQDGRPINTGIFQLLGD